MDAAHEWTDAQLEALERKMAREYSQAAKEMREKQEKALKAYSKEKEMREKALDNTPEAMKAHEEWLRRRASDQAWMKGMVDSLSKAASDANVKAMAALDDALPRIYAENANRAAFEVDKAAKVDTMFTLVDEDTVRHVMQTDQSLVQEVKRPKVNRSKDIRWNRQKFTSAITQGILQGESIPQIVKRTESIFGMNKAAAFRAARTATTGAENAGRVSSYKRAERLGIKLKQEWMATLDNRTRHSHRQLDGEKVEVGEKFSNGCRYPGDPQARGEEIWNCRCTLVAAVDGIGDDEAALLRKLPSGTSYEKWKKALARAVRDKVSVIPDPEWHNEPVTALETSADVKEYIEANHGLRVIGDVDKVPVEHMRGMAAGFDDAKARFGMGAANTLKINNRLGNLGKYNYETGTIEIKANQGGTYLSAMHEWTHSVDDKLSAEMNTPSGKMVYNSYSESLVERACAELGVKRGGKEYEEIISRMAGLNRLLEHELSKPHELLAYSVERVRVGRSNGLSDKLVELFGGAHSG